MLFRVTQTHGNSIHEFLSSYQVILAYCKHTKKYKFLHTFSIQKYIKKNFCCNTESAKQTYCNTKSALQTCCNTKSAIQIFAYRICIQISAANKFLHTNSCVQNLHTKIQKLHTNFCCKKISAYKNTETAYKFLLQKNFCIQNLHTNFFCTWISVYRIYIQKYKICIQISA